MRLRDAQDTLSVKERIKMNKLISLINKYRDVILYLFFGVCTTVINLAVFWVLNSPLKVNELIANIIAWVLAVLFAFFTNRDLVFHAGKNGSFFSQMLKFYLGRAITLALEELILLVFITLLHLNSMAVKIFAQVIVIILNFVISKLIIFKKRKEK